MAFRSRRKALPADVEEVPAVVGLPVHAAAAGWEGPLGDPGFDQSTRDYLHRMLEYLSGIRDSVDPASTQGGAGNTYADAYRVTIEDRDVVVANLSFTVSHLHGGERLLAGSVGVAPLGCILPLVLVNPRSSDPYMRAMTKPVKLGRDDFDRHFEVRSGHPEYAQQLLGPMADVLLTRDDWAFYLEFARLVSISAAPFQTVDEVTQRVATLGSLVSLIPASVREQYELKLPPMSPPAAAELSATDRQRAQAMMDAMTPDQRRATVARMRTEGPEAVIRDLLAGPS